MSESNFCTGAEAFGREIVEKSAGTHGFRRYLHPPTLFVRRGLLRHTAFQISRNLTERTLVATLFLRRTSSRAKSLHGFSCLLRWHALPCRERSHVREQFLHGRLSWTKLLKVATHDHDAILAQGRC